MSENPGTNPREDGEKLAASEPAEPAERIPTAADADEELVHKVRDELLAKTITPAPESGTPPADGPAWAAQAAAERRRLWFWVIGLAVLAAVAGVLGAVDPEQFQALRGFGLLLLTLAGLGLLTGRRRRATRAAKGEGAPPAPLSPRERFALSFAWFLMFGILLFTPDELAILIGVLLLHESGHFLGMRWFGYHDIQMFFIPLFGAAVQGENTGVPAWQEAIVLLLGPLPGLVLGCAIFAVDPGVPQHWLRMLATWLVAINFLKLMPFEPLDGGRLCNRLLFSRFRLLEAATVVLATVGLVFLCLAPGWICLSLAGVFAVFVLAPARYRIATAAGALQTRWPDLPRQLADLTAEQWRDLVLTTRGRAGTNPKILATQVKTVHARVLQRPASAPATAVLVAVYLAAIVLAVVTATLTPLGEDAGRWPVRLTSHVTGEHGVAK